MTVESDYFIAYGVVFRNDAAAAAKKKKAEGEAPALRVLGTKATFYNCTIEGGQGALYDQMGLHYFKSCTIRGTIDFIFGSAKSFYEDCTIVSVNNMEEIMTLPVAPPQLDIHDNPIKVAPGKGGFSFKTCTITGEGQQIFLGRMGTPSIYSYTQIAKEVVPIIYDKGNIFMPSNMTGRRCATFKCYGPGLEKIWHVKLRYAEAIYFLGTDFINGDSWILSIPPTDAETLLSV
uniref:Pectinesterase n=1 Tax=Zea mays TaxID=4577 RepID=A0A804U812_MAIZE